MQRDVKNPLSKPPTGDSPRGKSTTLGLEGLKLGDRASSKEPGAKPRPKGSAEEKSKPVTGNTLELVLQLCMSLYK